MKLILNFIKYFVIILLSCCIIGLTIIHIASSTILTKQYALKKLEETNYYEEIKKLVDSNFENYIGPSGLDEEVMNNIITLEQVKQDTNTIINNIYDGTNTAINTSQLENNLKNNINQFLKDQKINITQQKSIDNYIKLISEEYKNTITSTNYESNAHEILEKTNNTLQKVKMMLAIGVVVFSIVIILLNYKKARETISNIGIAITTSGVFCIAIKMYITTNVKISNILILNDVISNTFRNIVNDILNNLQNIGYISLACGIIVILIGNIIKKKTNNK